MAAEEFPVTTKSRVRRNPKRGIYDKRQVHAILDEGSVCHVGFVDGGQPFVIPCFYARDGDRLLLHGATGSRMFQILAKGVEACITVTLLDGLVFARSAFHHSMNYRSVVCFGRAERIVDREEKRRALLHMVDSIAPGRGADARPPNDSELKATEVLAFPLTEVSAKVRSGPPVDDPRDMELEVWAGEVPLRLTPQTPVPDPGLRAGIPCPAYLEEL
ncbi:MAG: pyridoxamine 5'-phosphate oxidase family protein [Gammaproteobacteria bacterium]